VISGIPSGATLSDGTHTFTAGAVTSQDVTLWDLSKLTISSPEPATFSLSATVSEHDGDSPAQVSSAMMNEAVTILPVPPSVSAGAAVSYTGGSAPVVLDSGLTISAPTSTLTSATVSIGAGFVVGDVLNYGNTKTFADGAVIHGSYNSSVLTLTAATNSPVAPTIADFQAALRSVTYSDGNNDPTHGGGDTSRTIDWSVNDGFLSSSNSTSTLQTSHVAPTVTAGNSATYTIGNGPVVLDNSITVTDVDSGGNLDSAAIQIVGFQKGDVLSFTDTNHIKGMFNATTGVLTLTGIDTVVDYQAALRSITYSFTPSNGDPTVGGSDPQRVIDWTVNDGNSVNGTSIVSTTTVTFAYKSTYWINASGGDWSTELGWDNWDNGVPNSTLDAFIVSSHTGAKYSYGIDIWSYETAEAHALTLNDVAAGLYDYGSLTIDSTLTVDAGSIVVEGAYFAGANGATMTVDGPLTIHGGSIEVIGGYKAGVNTWAGGALTAGDIVVDGGRLVVDASTGSSNWKVADPDAVLHAASINVETGGTVELHGTVHVTGVIETTGGNLIVGSDADFTGTDTLTFGANGGTVTFETSSGKYAAPDISGFGPGGTHSDVVDLADFDFSDTGFSESTSNGDLVLTVTEGKNVATFTFDNFSGTLKVASDGHGGTAITGTAADIGTVDTSVSSNVVTGTITASDPHSPGAVTTTFIPDGANYIGTFSVQPETSSNGQASVAFNFNPGSAHIPSGSPVTQSYDVAVSEGANTILRETVSVSIGSSRSDTFVFNPGIGADTIVNFNAAGGDMIDLSHFTNFTTVQQLQAVTTSDGHGDTVIDLGNHDSVTIAGMNIAGMNASQVQAALHSIVHLA
jgi:hypothetical protein